LIKIGNKELSFSETFIIRDNEEINIDAVVDNWPLKITIILLADSHGNTSLSWQAVSDNHARIEFKGWANPSGVSTQEPLQLGTTDTSKRAVYFSALNIRVGSTNRFDFQLLLGGAHE
jgi:hypothetical protein